MKKSLHFLCCLLFGSASFAQTAGNVGIGTTNPQAQLHTTGTVRFEGLAGQGSRLLMTDSAGRLFSPSVPINTTAMAIPDNGCNSHNPAVSTIIFSSPQVPTAASSIRVLLNLSHPMGSDIQAYLVAPNGKVLNLVFFLYNNLPYTGNTIFSDVSATRIENASGSLTGVFKPYGNVTFSGCGVQGTVSSFAALADNNGMINPAGIWTLKVYDSYAGNTGTLDSWAISLDGSTFTSQDNYVAKWQGGSLTKSAIYDNGNVGIGTANPGSRLTVNGSVSAAYRSISAAGYALTDSDYYVSYSGTANAVFTLPAASSSTNLKGRIYIIKNRTLDKSLTLSAAGAERIDGPANIVVSPTSTIEVINTGASSGTTWEILSAAPTAADNIRLALASAGCVSCAKYDAAAKNQWIEITDAEYTALQSISGMSTFAGDGNTMSYGSAFLSTLLGTTTQDFVNSRPLPGGYYPVALANRTGLNAYNNNVNNVPSGMKLKLSYTSQTSGYFDVPSSASTTPAVAVPADFTTYYYVLKTPDYQTTPGVNSNIAVYYPNGLCFVRAGSGQNAKCASGDSASPSVPTGPALFQVLATPYKKW